LKLTFFVPGIASPSGSKKAFAHPKTGRIIVMDTAKRKTSWQSIVSLHAQQAMTDAGAKLTNEAVAMTIDFYFPRPKCHFGSGKNAARIKETAPKYHTQKPDLTKLIRCTEDALTGIVYKDDCQVTERFCQKHWCNVNEAPGVEITLEVVL
jgi:Holliday junction resolvase RusA-like endonuclease